MYAYGEKAFLLQQNRHPNSITEIKSGILKVFTWEQTG